jgi:hypothetical protein
MKQINFIPDHHPIKDDPNSLSALTANAFMLREEWILKGMFAFVCWDWVNPLAEWIGKRRVLEVMAGTGWLAKALRIKRIDIRATDNYSWHKGNGWETVTAVEKADATDAIRLYGRNSDILIMSWPYMDDSAYHAMFAMKMMNRDALIVYIGEPEGRCTASDKFFEHFEEIQDPEFDKAAAKFKPWPGFRDRLQLGKYKP